MDQNNSEIIIAGFTVVFSRGASDRFLLSRRMVRAGDILRFFIFDTLTFHGIVFALIYPFSPSRDAFI